MYRTRIVRLSVLERLKAPSPAFAYIINNSPMNENTEGWSMHAGNVMFLYKNDIGGWSNNIKNHAGTHKSYRYTDFIKQL